MGFVGVRVGFLEVLIGFLEVLVGFFGVLSGFLEVLENKLGSSGFLVVLGGSWGFFKIKWRAYPVRMWYIVF